MIRIAIVDDDPVWIDQLQAYLHTYEQEQHQAFQIQIFEDGEDLIQQYQAHFDLIFLDIEMRFLDGMTTAKLIRETDPGVAILFITNMAQYAIRGYEVDAMDYMLKPVSYATGVADLFLSQYCPGEKQPPGVHRYHGGGVRPGVHPDVPD